ncbi:MAG: hypothetical protein K8S27_08390 [Candidatus Omnitrophica bacterium]|nr:hypothetical protein [Candidatus Omnitrophota bacterium]
MYSKKILIIFFTVTFLSQSTLPYVVQPAYAQGVITPSAFMGNVLNLPAVGSLVPLSDAYKPILLKGLRLDIEHPLKFDFILDVGEHPSIQAQDLEAESSKLIKYFLASLTVPEEDLWVNLSPHERDRIIPNDFGVTEMGRDLLAQDYLLKQLTASLMYPENDLGREFWERIYQKAYERFGTTDVLVNTFNKIWIIPDYAEVYTEGRTALIVDCHLKVMTEQDYINKATQEDKSLERLGMESSKLTELGKANMSLATEVIRDLLIPEIEKEVNTGKNFIQLRQIYHSLILATWFKQNLKESIISQVYVGKNKVAGVDVEDKEIKGKIYQQYLAAFKKGVYNYIREDYDPVYQTVMPRKYFSGGAGFERVGNITTFTSLPERKSLAMKNIDRAMLVKANLTTPGKGVVQAAQGQTQTDPDVLESPERRDFLKISGLAVASTAATLFMPSFLQDVQAQDKQALDPSLDIRFDYEYFKRLSGREGVDYFEKINKALSENKLPRQKVGRLLWQIYNASPMVWNRAQSIRILIRQGYIKMEEMNSLLDQTYDQDVLSVIMIALAQKPTPQVADLFASRIKKEYAPEWLKEPFYQMLQNAPRKALTRSLLAQVKDDDLRALGLLAAKLPGMNKRLVRMDDFSPEYLEALSLAATPQSEARLIDILKTKDFVDFTDLMIAIGKLRTQTSNKVLRQQLNRSDLSPREQSAIMKGLLHHGSSENLQMVNDRWQALPSSSPDVSILLEYIKAGKVNPLAAGKLIELAQTNKYSRYMQYAMINALSQLDTAESRQVLLEWSQDDQIVQAIGKELFKALAKTGTRGAENFFKSLVQQGKVQPQDETLIRNMGQLRTPGAFDYLKTLFLSTEDRGTKLQVYEAMTNTNSIVAVDWLLDRLAIDDIFTLNQFYQLDLVNFLNYEVGSYAFDLLTPYLKTTQGKTLALYKKITDTQLERFIGSDLRAVNNAEDLDNYQKEQVFALMARRLRKRPNALYLILALSQETTSHSFPAFFKVFNTVLDDEYGQLDYIKFARERMNSALLSEFLFTILIFNKFDTTLSTIAEIYGKENFIAEIFKAVDMGQHMDSPVLTAKLIEGILTFMRDTNAVTMDNILKMLIQANKNFAYLIKLMSDSGKVKITDQDLKAEMDAIRLPRLNPVWEGPQESWVDQEGVIQANLHWSTADAGEARHFEDFQKIFTNGKSVSAYYGSFSGYKNMSNKAEYRDKVKKRKAKGVLVKTFAQTGRKMEIYLYSDYEALSKQQAPITITRGHSGEEGNDNYSGQANGVRFVSHCRSINDADQLVLVDPLSALITIMGTGRAVETNPALYYFFEYLGTKDKYGDWGEVKDFVGDDHMPKSIQKYNFPTDDSSLPFAAALQLIKQAVEGVGEQTTDQAMLSQKIMAPFMLHVNEMLGRYPNGSIAATQQDYLDNTQRAKDDLKDDQMIRQYPEVGVMWGMFNLTDRLRDTDDIEILARLTNGVLSYYRSHTRRAQRVEALMNPVHFELRREGGQRFLAHTQLGVMVPILAVDEGYQFKFFAEGAEQGTDQTGAEQAMLTVATTGLSAQGTVPEGLILADNRPAEMKEILYDASLEMLFINGQPFSVEDRGDNTLIFDYPGNSNLVIRLSRSSLQLDEGEIAAFQEWGQEPFVPGIFAWGKTDNGHPFMIVEKIDGSALSKFKQLDDGQIEFVLSLMAELLKRRIYIADLKPSNIMIGTTQQNKTLRAFIPDVAWLEQRPDVSVEDLAAAYKAFIQQHFNLMFSSQEDRENKDPQGKITAFLDQVINKEINLERVGGIDFNPRNLEIRQTGGALDIDIPELDVQDLHDPAFPGFTPVILEIVPINNLPLLLGEVRDNRSSPLT